MTVCDIMEKPTDDYNDFVLQRQQQDVELQQQPQDVELMRAITAWAYFLCCMAVVLLIPAVVMLPVGTSFVRSDCNAAVVGTVVGMRPLDWHTCAANVTYRFEGADFAGTSVTDTTRSSKQGSYAVFSCDASLVGTPMRVCFRRQDPGKHVAIFVDGLLGSYPVGKRLICAGIVLASVGTTLAAIGCICCMHMHRRRRKV